MEGRTWIHPEEFRCPVTKETSVYPVWAGPENAGQGETPQRSWNHRTEERAGEREGRRAEQKGEVEPRGEAELGPRQAVRRGCRGPNFLPRLPPLPPDLNKVVATERPGLSHFPLEKCRGGV